MHITFLVLGQQRKLRRTGPGSLLYAFTRQTCRWGAAGWDRTHAECPGRSSWRGGLPNPRCSPFRAYIRSGTLSRLWRTSVFEGVVAADLGVLDLGAHFEQIEVADDHGPLLHGPSTVLHGLVVDDHFFLRDYPRTSMILKLPKMISPPSAMIEHVG